MKKKQQSFDITNIQLVFSNLLSDLYINQIGKHDTSLKAKWSRLKSRQKIRKVKRSLLKNLRNKTIFTSYDIYNFLSFLNHARTLELVKSIERCVNFNILFNAPIVNNDNDLRTGFIEVIIRGATENITIRFLEIIINNREPNISITWVIDRLSLNVIDYKDTKNSIGYNFNTVEIRKDDKEKEDTDVNILKNQVYKVLESVFSTYIELIFGRMEDQV